MNPLSLNENQRGWAKEKRNDLHLKIILFIISPFLSMLYSIRRLNTKSSFVVLYLFCLFFGMAFTTTSGRTDFVTSDSASYRLKFENWLYYTFDNYLQGLLGFLEFDSGRKDYFFETVAFFITRITENYHFFFLAIAAIYAFFMLKSLRYLVTLKEFKVTFVGLLLVYFFLDKNIFGINGVRFWTAYWIAVYCVFKIYVDDNKKYFLLVAITPFFHGAYWVFIAIITMHQIFKSKPKILVPFFVFSIFFGLVSLQLINAVSDFMPPFLQKLIASYTDEEYIELRSTAAGYGWWTMTILENVKFVFVNLLIYLFILKQKEISQEDQKVFSFVLFWMIVFNMFINIPSLGWRFFPLAYPLIAYLWLKTFGLKKHTMVLLFLPVAFAWDIIEIYRRVQIHIPLDLFYKNPVFLIYEYLVS